MCSAAGFPATTLVEDGAARQEKNAQPEPEPAPAKGDADLPPADGELIPETLGKLTLVADFGGHSAPIRKVFFTADSKQVITLSADHTIRFWNAATGEPIKVLHPPGAQGIDAAALSPDGKVLATATRYPEGKKSIPVIYLLSLPDGRVQRVLKGHATPVGVVVFSADGKRLASDAAPHRGRAGAELPPTDPNEGTRIWSLAKEEPEQVLKHQGAVYGLAFSPDGKRLARIGHQEISGIIDLASGKLEPIRQPEQGRWLAAAWSPDGNTLATINRGGSHRPMDARHPTDFNHKRPHWGSIYLHDPNDRKAFTAQGTWTGRKLSDKDDGGGSALAFSADSRNLLSTNQYWRLVPGRESLIGKAPDTEDALRFFNVDCALSPDGKLAATTGPYVTAVWAVRGEEDKAPSSLPLLLKARNLIHPNDAKVRAGWSADGKTLTWLPDRSFHLVDLHPGPGLEAANFRGLIHSQNGYALRASTFKLPGSLALITVTRGSKKHHLRGSIAEATLVGNDKIAIGRALYDANTGRSLRALELGGWVRSIAGGRYLLTVSHDQTMRIWDPDQDRPLLSLYVSGNDWIAWTPQGHYAANPGGERLMGWKLDNGPGQAPSFYPAERFRKQMYRPDVIKLVLEKGNVKDALAVANTALKNAGGSVAEGEADLEKLLPPTATLHIVDGSALPKLRVKASAKARTAEQPITALRLLVDGRPLADGDGLQRFDPGAKEASAEWTVTLPPGKHQLTVLVRCPDSSSKSNTVEVAVADPDKQANLHVLAIGVNDYEDGTLKLDFAAKDARDIAAGFRHCKGELYHEVSSEVLVDAKARKEAILAQVSELRKKARPNDLVVVYFAGHGVKQKEKFYLLTVEAKTDNLAGTAISGDELRKSLGEFPCQVLLMLDACHSSAGLKNFRPAVDDITRNLTDDDCGVAVLCSAMGHEKALEKDGNGLFTRAVLDGLNRKEGVPFNTESRLFYVHHLHSYVFDRVSGQSGGRQHPFLSLPWVVESFPVARFEK